MKSPAFQFYPDDFLGSGKVGTMTVDEVGAYTLLLCLDWNENGFVFDEEELARWCRVSRAKFRKLWVRVSRCFDVRDGRYFNARLEKEREKQTAWREKSAKGGKVSAAKRGATTLEPPLAPKGNIPFPSPTPVNAFIAAGAAGQDGAPPESDPAQPDEQTNLERFPKAVCDAGWEAYSKRVGAVNYGRFRKALLPVYQSRESEHPTAEQLVGAVEAFVEARDAEPPQYRGKYTVEHYASQLHGYVRIGAMPHMDEWGEPTERGRICGFGVGA